MNHQGITIQQHQIKVEAFTQTRRIAIPEVVKRVQMMMYLVNHGRSLQQAQWTILRFEIKQPTSTTLPLQVLQFVLQEHQVQRS